MSILWFTGNTGAGKSTIAERIAKNSGSIVLHGDNMRASISCDLGLSKSDRIENNWRTARLANELDKAGHSVIVAVICPYQSQRDEISAAFDVDFIYVPGGKAPCEEYPYEIPEAACTLI